MSNDNLVTISVEVDSELLEQLNAIIAPMGLTPEMLFARFLEWCVAPETRGEAMAWLLKCKEELE